MRTLLHFFLFLITLWVSIIIPPVHSQCIKDQQLSLLQFKKSLVFVSLHPSTKLISWNASTDCCSWVGVTCSRNGRVLGLDISSEHVSAGIDNSSSLFHLHYLQSLNLADNLLGSDSQSIPSAIGKLANLRYLDLSDNRYPGKIPIEISRLTRLVVLALSDNVQLGSPNLRMLVQNFTELRELYLDSVQISEQGSEWCQAISSSLPNLKVLSLSSCNLSGPLLESLAKLQSLSVIRLNWNNISAPVPGFFANFSNLTVLSLPGCELHGTFPKEIFQLPSLQSIDLSFNDQLDGSLPEFPRNGSLQYLDLSWTNFSGLLPNSIGNLKMLSTIYIQECYFTGPMPKSMTNLTRLVSLSMSGNKLEGSIPSFSGAKNVNFIDLSYNGLTDFSRNYFISIIPSTIGYVFPRTTFFSLSSNNLNGIIPESLCNSHFLKILDLSNSSLSGTVPHCLTTMWSLEVLNVRRNNLTNVDDFSHNCGLKTLDISENHLQGRFLKSLVNCTQLEVLNLGKNLITEPFPCFLRNTSTLRVLVLRSNKFYGHIGCHKTNGSWPVLQIIDLAHNNFSGEVPGTALTTLQAMRTSKDAAPWKINNLQFDLDGIYYQEDTITVTNKGLDMELVFVLAIFTSIDFSYNKFNGSIPKEIGELKSLYALNLSNNAFTGAVPSSLGNLSQLESLDLSKNKLSGQIPPELTKLTFLEFLNLSYNQLVGRIPSGAQFSTFDAASFEGNKGLWGPPLTADNRTGFSSPKLEGNHSNARHEIDWDIICPEIGFTCGFGIVIGSLLFCKRWRKCWNKDLVITGDMFTYIKDTGDVEVVVKINALDSLLASLVRNWQNDIEIWDKRAVADVKIV
ncbi:receptor-like protein 19 [Rosa chinensis]|uniref:receptor-like protein 19 n=1 Tax=Rosa chinensis TaxID=74649 RepID=UPI000D090AFE|nr:receptor-like protein 19 [Rosa chinensis]